MSGAGASGGSKRLPSEVLKDWPSVDIDEEGVFKYVLIEAYAEDEKDGQVCLMPKFFTVMHRFKTPSFFPSLIIC